MGVDTRVYIPGITIDDFYKFIKTISQTSKINSTIYANMWQIDFTFFTEDRTAFVHNITISSKQAKKRAKENNWEYEGTDDYNYIHERKLPDNTQGILSSLGLWGLSKQIMQLICYRFGGYFLSDDSKYIEYTKISKDLRKLIKEVFYDN